MTAGDFTGDGNLDLAIAGTFEDAYGGNDVAVVLSNGDGTFQPAQFYPVGNSQYNISTFLLADDFTGNGHLDLAGADGADGGVSVLLGNGNGTFQPGVSYAVGLDPSSIAVGDFNGGGFLDLAVADGESDNVSILLSDGDGTLTAPGQFATTPQATPLIVDVSGDGTDDVLVVDGAGNILYRQGIPGQPGSFDPPVVINPGDPSRDIAWVPETTEGSVLVSVDALDNAVSLFAWRDGSFVNVGSLKTGPLPAQIIVADLSGDGLDDLIVRNAGDGTLSVFMNDGGHGSSSSSDPFGAPLNLPVGLGVSDVQAIDTAGNGRLDLVVTNKLSALVSVLQNLGAGRFAPPAPYRAGTGLALVYTSYTPEVSSLDATAGVAGGAFTTGGPTDLVTINPGSDTLDVLVGLGGGRFANPIAIHTSSPAEVVRVGDFNNDGIPDLAVLTPNGVSIYLGNGHGGFDAPITYDAGPEPSGLTVVDANHDGNLDLLVGNAYGDVLVLLGTGNGTFEPYREANQSIELAVADLSGNGSKDVIYADQGLNRVVVDYGVGNSAVLGDQSTGLLEPGAVALADLNGDGIPDLIVANSGSNNVLIYPGLGNGQFGAGINDGNGYFVGTDPVGITVADLTGSLPDLVIADKGSNEVSILLNESQKGGAISFLAGPRLNSGGVGPVSTVVGNFTSGAYPDILVTNSGSNDVTLLKGVGQGFFDDQNPRVYSVGTDPVTSFVGNFDGKTDLVTVNTGSNNLTLVSGLRGIHRDHQHDFLGRRGADAAFAFESSIGFDDLVVGNGGDGTLALFEGGTSGLTLMSTEVDPDLPSPTDLAFSALSGGEVEFYAVTAGHESADTGRPVRAT